MPFSSPQELSLRSLRSEPRYQNQTTIHNILSHSDLNDISPSSLIITKMQQINLFTINAIPFFSFDIPTYISCVVNIYFKGHTDNIMVSIERHGLFEVLGHSV